MRTLKILSALLCYPQEELQAALSEMAEVLQQEDVLPEQQRRGLLALIDRLERADLMDLQEQYVGLFDRGRALSLHLFEHVHGESRDRGQAMVDLLEIYRRHGYEMNQRELPDYIPLFLEYLAQRPAEEALDLLAQSLHVIALLGARLAERGCDYHVVFDALAALAGEPTDIEAIRHRAATEGPDETVVNMDEIWEEEAVTFLAGQERCGVAPIGGGDRQAVRWMPGSGAMPRSVGRV